MYLSNVRGSRIAKLVALLTFFAVIISLLPVSAFAEENTPATEPVATSSEAMSSSTEGVTGETKKELVAPVVSEGACEIEGHKYNATGNPLKDWTIGLMKVLTFSDRSESHDVATDVTDKDGHFCLQWDGYTGTTVVEEPHSFSYRVYEVLKAGWKYLSVEEGVDFNNLNVVDDADVEVSDGRASVQIGEVNGYIYANAEHHVDFYNQEIDPCDIGENDKTKTVTSTTTDPCNDTKTIGGYKFNDANANKLWDKGEVAIADWEIVLTQGDADPVYARTDSNGYYSFVVENGSYQVTETQQTGWEQTATIGDGADGNICYITVEDEITEAALDNNDDEEVVEDYTCDFGNHEITREPVCKVGENLLVNGSFEDPVVEGDWNIFATVAGWTIALSNGLELWANGFYGGASDGNQNAELDGNSPTKITQNVTTVAGATYELRFDFSARPDADSIADNNVDGLVNGLSIMNAVANGSDVTTNTWSTHAQTFIAAGTSTEIGLEDKGTANKLGSLIDNAVVCLVSNPNGGGDNNGGDTPRRSGGGSGTRVKRAPTGEVLGASTSKPAGLVLGDATSTLPVGAPNTGAGGTSQIYVQLPSIVAILPKTLKIK